jgi:two-component system, NtrC family, sensor kinase
MSAGSASDLQEGAHVASGTGADVLVVDDEPGIRDLLELELTAIGHRVSQCADGLEAIALLERREFDLVVTDVKMPGATGIQVLKAAKALSADTEVIIVTGYADLDEAVECLRSGAFDLIHKPFELQTFHAAVEHALERRRLHPTRALSEVSEDLLCGPGLVYERIAIAALRLLDADDVTVMLLGSDLVLRIVFATGISDAIRATTTLLIGERIAGRVALDRSPAVLPDAFANEPRFAAMVGHGRVRSAVVSPLLHRQTLLGVIAVNRVANERPFRRADVELTAILARMAALAIHNERLTEKMVAAEQLAVLGQLGAAVVHEIRNPLASVITNASEVRGALTLLQEAELVPRSMLKPVFSALVDLDDGTTRIRDVLDDMRTLYVDRKAGDTVFDLRLPIQTAIRCATPAVKYAARLEVALGDQPMLVEGSPGALCQLFINLIVNAGEALDGRHGRIGVRSQQDDPCWVKIEVHNDGPGIGPVALSRIFEPFHASDKRTGLGLGLAIVRDIAELHGGRVSVQSVEEGGTTFTVSLPLATRAGTS